jgi:hypothetical protein
VFTWKVTKTFWTILTISDYSEIVNFLNRFVFISLFVSNIMDGLRYQNCTEFLPLLDFITFIVVHLCCVHPACCGSLHWHEQWMSDLKQQSSW